jgi:hypothetical protein
VYRLDREHLDSLMPRVIKSTPFSSTSLVQVDSLLHCTIPARYRHILRLDSIPDLELRTAYPP